MANQVCRQSIHACGLRVGRLDSAGAPLPGANNLYELGPDHESLISIEMALIIEEGADLTQKNGCDSICATYQGDDRLKGVTLTITMCDVDHELIELLTSATLITDGGDTIGHMAPASNAAAQNGVSVEAWSSRWDGAEQDPDFPYHHWVWPRFKGRFGDHTLDNSILPVVVVGKGFENSSIGDGPANDWPTTIGRFYGVFDENEIPDGVCGYQTTPVQAS